MLGFLLAKTRTGLSKARFQMGKLLFPLMEPLFILRENLRPEVRRHFDQAIKSLEKDNVAVSLLNLNMVLSLRPRHFLARVYRGRIYLRENQFRLASDDFIQANKISAYRFSHYGLYQEYTNWVNEGMGTLGSSMVHSFHQAFKMPEKVSDTVQEWDSQDMAEQPEMSGEIDSYLEEDLPMVGGSPGLTLEEKHRFDTMGPITGQEVDQTDWDSLLKKLIR